MRETFRQSMAWLHTWVGLLLGWLLYFMFITGTAGYFDTEIDRWMQPELPVAHTQATPVETLSAAFQRLHKVAPDASRWFITLTGDRNNPYPGIFWQGAGGRGEELLDPSTGAPPEARSTAGGQLLYQMHWRLHYLPRSVSDWIVVLASMLMLVALISGIVVHKKIFKDFFTFRPKKGQRSWLDAHNVASVISLPFQLMITYSGLVFMMFSVMPLTVSAFYGVDAEGRQSFFGEAFPGPEQITVMGESAPLASAVNLMEGFAAGREAETPRYLVVSNPGDANARVTVGYGELAGPLQRDAVLVLDGVTAKALDTQPADVPMGRLSRDLLVGLHEGLFAGPLLRGLYFLSGLLGAAMIATGLVLWTVKRRQRADRTGEHHAGLRLVESLNVATIAGLPLAIAAYFWANRLLPVGWEARAQWEINILFIVWACLFLHAGLRASGKAWVEQLAGAALTFFLLPFLNALTTDRPLWQSVAVGDWIFVGFEFCVLVISLGFAAAAFYLWRHQRQSLKGIVTGTGTAEAQS
ncbi:PepSY-associated TM helix domain-containing protein [uncultured Halopseudomonas sp.]|uniref:PepSY-associated TM helix domain-containing protein n=1 Tax=uncultured Halopseudomonas sp. TaxID=2901193 RepID=UPI0030EB74C1|tara:strand:+ start:19804 stop:21378 length:1575 start_codon:yes stop_codon:yes gene_type:complete